MPIYNEVWEEEDFMFRNMINLQTLTKNHVKLLDNLKFEFVEYKVIKLLYINGKSIISLSSI
ncbi:unnamed protein product [Paramecium pentaurelia]|uniref:Uncharacterized protein n=1 Tax=Paramecium pentaurelia TaxID=43138 RepID=A0A8S1V6M2_9CILI|nr:unnamed protein product [Paramecium pentaurelia]